MNTSPSYNEWDEVIAFWLPEGDDLNVDGRVHHRHWEWRMRGGADEAIAERFAALTEQGARGALEHWAQTAAGRLALIIVLDQFSRSIWRGTARAFAQDKTALALAKEGLNNGQFASLPTPWSKIVFTLPLGHCEGADHLARIDRLIEIRTAILEQSPSHLVAIYSSLVQQAQVVRKVIATFGRHPHRNAILKRSSTAAERTYIAQGDFPHLNAFSGG